jgi:cyclic pyranopterin phosphate synthase
LRFGSDDSTLAQIISAHWRQRDDRYSELRQIALQTARPKIEMSYIGG